MTDTVLNRLNDLERRLDKIEAFMQMVETTDYDEMKTMVDELFKTVFGEMKSKPANQDDVPDHGWLIVSPNQPDHYWTCGPDEDYSVGPQYKSDRWSGDIKKAWRFPNKVAADKQLRVLRQENDGYFLGVPLKVTYFDGITESVEEEDLDDQEYIITNLPPGWKGNGRSSRERYYSADTPTWVSRKSKAYVFSTRDLAEVRMRTLVKHKKLHWAQGSKVRVEPR